MSRDPAAMSLLADCEHCMQHTDQSTRQEMGCGFEPLVPLARRRRLWTHRAHRGPRPTLCAAYTTRLPEVLEVASEHVHWSKGNAGPMTDQMRAGIEILDAAESLLKAWLRRSKKDGGGGA